MASNPALVQLWLVPVAVIPGLLAFLGLLSNNQAGLCVVALYLVSRWHTSRIQRRLEPPPPTPPSAPPSSPPSRRPPASRRRD